MKFYTFETTIVNLKNTLFWTLPRITAKVLIADADIIFCLDFSNLERVNALGDFIKGSVAKKILIDHPFYILMHNSD